MTRKLVSTGSPFEAAGGYSRAVIDGDWCWVAGTTGYDYATMMMPAAVEDQARNAFVTIERVLVEAGFSLADAVRVVYYITDTAYAGPVTSVAGDVLGTIRPAATMVVAGLIRPEMKVEIELTAKRRA
jgi:enamine deaminase RidA (YjgF/YER057c/UK114 family)